MSHGCVDIETVVRRGGYNFTLPFLVFAGAFIAL
jgi:hypothetical protein